MYILPGGAGRNDDYWYSWLARELRRRRVPVQILSQNRLDPGVRARQLQGRFFLTPDTILVGHSFGGLVAMKWLELAKQPIAGLLLVDVSVRASFAQAVPQALLNEQKTTRAKAELKRRMREYLHSWNWNINYSQVRKFAKRKLVLSEQRTGKLFSTWKPGHLKLAKAIGARLQVSAGRQRHFTAGQEPEVLRALLSLLLKKVDHF